MADFNTNQVFEIVRQVQGMDFQATHAASWKPFYP